MADKYKQSNSNTDHSAGMDMKSDYIPTDTELKHTQSNRSTPVDTDFFSAVPDEPFPYKPSSIPMDLDFFNALGVKMDSSRVLVRNVLLPKLKNTKRS